MKRLYYIDKLGWPVEIIKGRWFLNFLRRLIHTRKITFKRPSCLDPKLVSPPDWKIGASIDLQRSHGISLEAGAPYDLSQKEPNSLTRKIIEKMERGEDVKSFDTVEELFEDLDNEIDQVQVKVIRSSGNVPPDAN